MALEYLITPLAFYLVWRRELPGFRTKLGLGTVYFGSFMGIAGVQVPFALMRTGGYILPPFPVTLLPAGFLSLNLLFPAFSGLALARLGKEGSHPGRTSLAIPLVAMAFALPSNLIYGYEGLSGPNLDFASISLGLFLVSLPVQFIVFYALGQMHDLQGRSFPAFGLLFLGAYVGGVVGTALSVGLFGQTQWVALSGVTSWENGIVYTNMPNSLVILLEGLNPIGSLPFLSFFGLTLSQVGSTQEKLLDPIDADINNVG